MSHFNTPNQSEMTSFSDVSKQVDMFEELLLKLGLPIKTGSQLEHGCLVLKELLDEHTRALSGDQIESTIEFRDDLQIALGVLNIIQLSLANQDHQNFSSVFSHLKLLGSGSVAQTTPSAYNDDVGNKLFELRLALACLNTGTELEMDDPDVSSKGTNPDILCKMRDGRLWGFACKVIHGDAPMSLFDNLAKGVDQIECSPADIGLVVISLKNKLPHNEIMPLTKNFLGEPSYGFQQNWQAIKSQLSHKFQTLVFDMVQHVGQDSVSNLFLNKKTLPSLSSPLETTAIIKTSLGSTPTFCSYLHTATLENGATRFDSHALQILFDINSGLNPNRPLEQLKHS